MVVVATEATRVWVTEEVRRVVEVAARGLAEAQC